MRSILTLLAAATITISLVGTTSAQQSSNDGRAEVYGRLLSTSFPVDFNENPLRDVIEFLSEMSGIDILTTWADDFLDGLDPEAPITLTLRSPTDLIDILDLVMSQATDDETSWVLGNGYIEIGLKDMLDLNAYVLIYPIRELLFTVPTFDNAPEMDLQSVMSGGDTGEISGSLFDNGSEDENERISEDELADELIEIITSIVDPLRWEVNGGIGGSIQYFHGSLIINAPDYLHRQVGGYPFTPTRSRAGASSASRAPRYVSLSGQYGMAQLIDVAQFEVPVLVGGRVISSGGDG